MNFENISVSTCKKIIDSEDALLLDVRTASECASGIINGAVNIPLDKLESSADQLPRDKKILVYCATGNRSQMACNILALHGIENSANVDGGIFAWKREGFEVV